MVVSNANSFTEMTNDHFLPKTSFFFFYRKPNMNHQNPKRSEIEKRKTLGNIMKFQNLKLERERERERNLRSKHDNVLSRERVPSAWWAMIFLTMGYDCLRVSE